MFTLEEILRATEGRLINGSQNLHQISGVSTDTRTVQSNNLFIAIKGENFDGHHFVGQAFEKGASACIVSQKKVSVKTSASIIWVADTVKALGQLAHLYRQRFSIPVVALTGSAGKTTTKEMIAAVLSSRYNVLKNIGTENNHIGVPMTLFKLDNKHDVAVLELGTNQFGDIRWLTQIVSPTVSLITNIGESHLQGLKNPAGVFKEKYDIIKYMQPGGAVILNGDDRYLTKIIKQLKNNQLVTFGVENKTDYQAQNVQIFNNERVMFKLFDHERQSQLFELDAPVFHGVYSALAAISVGKLLKIPLKEMRDKIRDFHFPKGRQIINRINKYWIIDDTYNANPISVKSALNTLGRLEISGRKIMVCGDMLELGTQARALHAAVGRYAAQSDLDALFTLGAFSNLMGQAAQKLKKNLVTYHGRSIEDVTKRLKEYCRAGDLILVKGSRGMKMERAVDFLREEFAKRAD